MGIKDKISQMKTERLADVATHVKKDEAEFATPLMHQLKIVQKRTNLAFWRSPNYGFTRLFNHVIIALLTGLAYLNLLDSRTSRAQVRHVSYDLLQRSVFQNVRPIRFRFLIGRSRNAIFYSLRRGILLANLLHARLPIRQLPSRIPIFHGSRHRALLRHSRSNGSSYHT